MEQKANLKAEIKPEASIRPRDVEDKPLDQWGSDSEWGEQLKWGLMKSYQDRINAEMGL
ncbi:hypothetical protein [Acanthopleuribacter pedis]|uniref:Uncharacterized protein n=1 Tax=Acanthopleuribacter pedis TaxID=442870 RepID=A0A8J7QAL8_9BACT|nr:hypothetical protein [Acanthopleuribacter pedis]MBO1320544.1 hypothetical protein [Acanthopleuribacter pedis]